MRLLAGVSALLLLLAEKLYRRNPREWKKGGHASVVQSMAAAVFLPVVALR